MPTPILYHSLLVLFATVYPVSLPQIASNFIPRTVAKHSNEIYLAGSVLISITLLLLSLSLVSIAGHLHFPVSPLWYLAAVMLAPLLIGLEFLVGAAALRLSGIKVQGISVSSNWVNISNLGFGLTLALAISEELLFRQLWGVILLENLSVPIWGFVLLSACAYGFNHLYYGIVTFLQKSVTGVVLALVFVYSGGAILVPIIAHGLQNSIVLIGGRCKTNG